MGLALCHRIPRHPQLYVAVTLLLCSVVLQAVCIGLHGQPDGGGVIKDHSGQVATVSAFPKVRGEFGCDDDGNCSWTLCSADFSMVSMACARFLEGFHNVNRYAIVAFVFSIGACFFCLFFSLELSGTPGQVRFHIFLAMCFPTGFLCATLATFFSSVVGSAESAVKANDKYVANGTLTFHRGPEANLCITATCLCGAALLLTALHWIFERYSAPTHKRKENLANDDWARQREVLKNHARAVVAEIQFKAEMDPTFVNPTPLDD